MGLLKTHSALSVYRIEARTLDFERTDAKIDARAWADALARIYPVIPASPKLDSGEPLVDGWFFLDEQAPCVTGPFIVLGRRAWRKSAPAELVKRITRGFVVQAPCALLDAFRHDDWDSLTLEPEEPTEKVDITWKVRATDIRKIQVKSSDYAFGEADVRRWAVELAQGARGVKCLLQLCGPVSSGVSRMARTGHNGVAIEIVATDVDSLQARCRDALSRELQHAGRHGVQHGDLVQAIPRLSGLLFADGLRSREWTREELWSEVERSVQPSSSPGLAMRWCQNRIVEVQANGDSVETYINSFYNETGGELPVPGVSTRLSDSPSDVLYVFDGEEGAHGEADILAETGMYVVWTAPRGMVSPGGWRHLGCVVRRQGLAQVGDDSLRWRDVQLPHALDGTYPARVWVVLPDRWRGDTRSRTAELVDPGGCSWKMTLTNRDYHHVEVSGGPSGAVQTAKWVDAVRAVAGLASGHEPGGTLDLSDLDGLVDLPMQAMRILACSKSLL